MPIEKIIARITGKIRHEAKLDLVLARIFPIRYTDLDALVRYIGARSP
jgi:hypothetical protein